MDKTRKKTNSSRARASKHKKGGGVQEKSKNKQKVSQSRKKKLLPTSPSTTNTQARRTKSVLAMKSAGPSTAPTQSVVDGTQTPQTPPSPDANNVKKKADEKKAKIESPMGAKKKDPPIVPKMDATQEDAPPAAPAPAPGATEPQAANNNNNEKPATVPHQNEPSSGLEVLGVKDVDPSKPPPKMDDGYEDFGPGAQ